MTAPVVIGVFGISGVGKSWLASEVAARIPGALHLQGSALIKQGLADPSVSSEELRRASGDHIIANQAILIAMFNRTIAEHSSSLVLLDGHLLIDTPAEMIEIPQEVIAALQLKLLVHVEDEPKQIAARRHGDAFRTRPVRGIDTIAAHQNRSRDLCKAYGCLLGIPMHIVESGDVDRLAAICRY
ncbi:MAG: AAA family ATPase [Rhodospirillales bacterium]|nr:AAA family ATPase [Rhodospirillales bacterium]